MEEGFGGRKNIATPLLFGVLLGAGITQEFKPLTPGVGARVVWCAGSIPVLDIGAEGLFVGGVSISRFPKFSSRPIFGFCLFDSRPLKGLADIIIPATGAINLAGSVLKTDFRQQL